MRKKTHDEYVADVARVNPNIEVVGKYISSRVCTLHKCKICGNEWMANPNGILKGKGCPLCSANAMKTHEKYVEELKIKNPTVEVVGTYTGNKIPILHHCLVHDNYWNIRPSDALYGKGCSECSNDKKRLNFAKHHNEYVSQLFDINKDIEVCETYINAKTSILHKCKICGYTWYPCPTNILKNGKCPQCNESSGERQVRQWLEKYNIKYVYQMPFDACCDVKPLPFDFYLPELNICIEYDGIQHFEPVDFANKGKEWAENQLEYVRKHDKIKTDYCKNNNIKLLRIPYYANIEEELNNFLFI